METRQKTMIATKPSSNSTNSPAMAIKQKKRFLLSDSSRNVTDCEEIRNRHNFPTLAGSADEAAFPILFVRIVYRDYFFTELLLSSNYQPQNFYCFLMDFKSALSFTENMQQLGKCFENVIVIASNLTIKSNGVKMNSGYLECLTEMRKFNWNYAITLQQHDVILRTNWELVQIMQMLNGSNHIAMATAKPWVKRLNRKYKWTIGELEFFGDKNETCRKNKTLCDTKLRFAKGGVQSLLSRPFIEFIFTKISVTKFIGQLESTAYTDELCWQTLNYDPILGVDGGFPTRCFEDAEKGKGGLPTLLRFVIWSFGGNRKLCGTRKWRHTVCVFGGEDVKHLSTHPHIMLNKVMPEFDATPAICLQREIRRRQELSPRLRIDEFATVKMEYEKLIEIRYAKWKMNPGAYKQNGTASSDINCFIKT